MKALFVGGYGPIITQTKESMAFYRDSLDLSFTVEADGDSHTEPLEEAKQVPIWPLSQAAQSGIGVNEWSTELAAWCTRISAG